MKLKITFILLLIATSLDASIKDGKMLYDIHCKTCHSIDMTGGEGGDFNMISYTKTKKELFRYTLDPASEYKNFGYVASAMPNLPLRVEEIENLVDYIDSLQPFKKWMTKSYKKKEKISLKK